MINQETADKLGVELSALEETFNGFKVMSNEDLDTLKSNLSKGNDELKEKYQAEGRKVGKELLLKELKDTFKLEYDGRKSTDNFVNAVNEKFASATNDEYAEKLKALSSKLELTQSEFDEYKGTVKANENKRVVSDALTKEFNQYNGKTSLGIDDLMTLYIAKNNVKYNGDSMQIFNGENVLKDDIGNPVTIQDSIKNFVEGSYLSERKPEGGRGEGDSKGNGLGKVSFDKFEAKLQKDGLSKGSVEYNNRINQAVVEGIIEV